MKHQPTRHHAFKQAVVAIMGMLVAGLPALAQNAAAAATSKWRPKAGIYAIPGKGFEEACGEFQDVVVELAESAVSGHEWGCKVTRLTDTAPGAIKLDMSCYDYNLAEFIKKPEDTIFKEVMLLKRIGAERIIVRKTVDGKFKDPEFRASYCPPDAQRAYLENQAQSKAEAEQKAAEEKLRLDPWRPREGVYATSGTNFNDHCLKNGDATIELSERSISIGSDRCSITFIRNEPDDTIKLFATCIGPANVAGSVSPGPDTIILTRVDDKTLFTQKSRNGNLTGPGERLSYCGEDVQKMHAQQKAGK